MNAVDFNYLLAYVNSDTKFPIPVSLGLCVPRVCKPADLNELKPYLMPSLNSYLPVILDKTKGFDLSNVKLTSEDIVFENSHDLNEKYTQVTLFNGFFIALMVFYVIATVLATLVAHKRHKERKRKVQEKKHKMEQTADYDRRSEDSSPDNKIADV
jgi:large-conductance mechanosensitive channel